VVFYGALDRAYTWSLHFVLKHRLAVSIFALLVMLSSVWLYGHVKQDFIPINVDQAEFSVQLSAPEGTSLTAMDEALRAVEAELREMPQIRLIMGTAGELLFRFAQLGEGLFAHSPSRGWRTINLSKFWKGLKAGEPLAVFRGNYSALDVQQLVRQRLRKFTHLRPSVRILRQSIWAVAVFRISTMSFAGRTSQSRQIRQRTARASAGTSPRRRRRDAQAG
jgi:HAE1 family hydrophobic/amphiphilic exporter-1